MQSSLSSPGSLLVQAWKTKPSHKICDRRLTVDKELVTIWRFSLAIQAEMAQCILGNNGIESYLADANIVSMDWFLGNAVGGVKLEVAAVDVPAALKILEENPGLIGRRPEAADEHDEAYQCLACGQRIGATENQCPSCGWSPQ